MKTAIVTGSDSKYFHYLLNLCESLKKTNTLQKVTLCILSIDLDEYQIKLLSKYSSNIKTPKWDFKFNFKADNWKKLLTARPFLKDYFPKFKNYIWLDADTNVLNNNFVDVFNSSLDYYEMSIAPEDDKSYLNFKLNKTFKNIFFDYFKVQGWSYKNNSKFFSKKYASKLINKPIFNAGVFSIKSSSFIWNLWKKYYRDIINKSKTQYCLNMDQASLNKIIYENINNINILNVKYNWLIKNKLPFLDKNNNLYSTNFPFEKIEILHFTQIDINKKKRFLNPCKKKYKKYSFAKILNINS